MVAKMRREVLLIDNHSIVLNLGNLGSCLILVSFLPSTSLTLFPLDLRADLLHSCGALEIVTFPLLDQWHPSSFLYWSAEHRSIRSFPAVPQTLSLISKFEQWSYHRFQISNLKFCSIWFLLFSAPFLLSLSNSVHILSVYSLLLFNPPSSFPC